MGLEFKIDVNKMIIYISATGQTTDKDFYNLFNVIKYDNHRKDEMNVLLDFRKHETVVQTDTVYVLTDLIERKAKKVKWAFLISRTVSFGMANMAAVFLAEKNIEVKTFEDFKQAEAWLTADN